MRAITAALAALCATAFTVAPVHAATATPCTSPLSDTSVGRLVVPAGATCTLTNVTVDGGVRVWEGGSLLTQGTTVNGSVVGRGAATVRLIDTDVLGTGTAGNINLTGTVGRIVIGSAGCAVDPNVGNNITLIGNHGRIAICYMTVGETITLQGNDKTIGAFHNTTGNPFIVQNNTATFIRLRHNEVGLTGGGSLLVHNNTTTGNSRRPDGLRLYNNHSHNGFSCAANDDAPVGTGNTAESGMSGQCVGL
jgi:hypothetical protein